MQIAIKMRQRSKIFHKQGMRLRFPEVEPFTWHQTLKPTKFMQIKSNKVKLTFVILTQRVYKTHLNDPIYCFWAYTFNICGLVVGNSKKSHNTKNKNMTEVMSLFFLVFPKVECCDPPAWSTTLHSWSCANLQKHLMERMSDITDFGTAILSPGKWTEFHGICSHKCDP
jgi:hypothetical protein